LSEEEVLRVLGVKEEVPGVHRVLGVKEE